MVNVIDLRQVDLNLLVIFEAVFSERSVKRAAGRLLLGQSAVSMALGRLRELLHDDLFVKVATGVEPTSKAIAIEPQVRQALELVHGALYESGDFEPKTASRVVRVGLADDLEIWLLPSLIDVLQRTAPGITLVSRSSNWYTGLGLVDRGEVDVVLGILPKAGGAMISEILYEERFVSLFDPAKVRRPLTLQRFLDAPHVLMSVSGDRIGLVDEALAARGQQRRLVATTSSFGAFGSLVRSRRLIGTLPRRAAEHLARSLGLATAETPVEMKTYPVAMIWHSKTDHDPMLRWLRGELRALAARPRARSPAKPRRLS